MNLALHKFKLPKPSIYILILTKTTTIIVIIIAIASSDICYWGFVHGKISFSWFSMILFDYQRTHMNTWCSNQGCQFHVTTTSAPLPKCWRPRLACQTAQRWAKQQSADPKMLRAAISLANQLIRSLWTSPEISSHGNGCIITITSWILILRYTV